MSARPMPSEGDLILRCETRDGRRVFVFHTVDSPDQFIVQAEEEAIARATAFARQRGIRAWLDEGNHVFSLIADPATT